MAFDPKPSTWLPNWSEDGTDITLPIASVPELSAAEADANTGDIRKVLYALCEKLAAKWNSVAAADRPTKMQIVKGQAINPATSQITTTYSFTFVTEPSGVEVVAE